MGRKRGQPHPEEAISRVQSGAWLGPFVEGELPPQGEVFQDQGTAVCERQDYKTEEREYGF